MEEIPQVPKIVKRIDVIYRRKALLAACVLTALSAGLGVYLSQPKVFQSESLLSYQQQKVHTGRMSPDDDSKLKDVVSSLTQIVTSRSSLEKIITDQNLFEQEREYLPMEDVVEKMRRDIQIIPSSNGNTFRVVYTGSDPAKVTRVANALAGRFIEENMKYREERASETSAYTTEELQIAKKMLDGKEAVMRDYKLKYYNEMADQRGTNMERLISLQNHNQSRQESIQNLERTRALLRDQIAMRNQLLEASKANPVANEPEQVFDERETLERLRGELRALELKYKEQHPRVVYLKNKIDKLEKSVEGTPRKASVAGNFDNTLNDLDLQIKDIDFSIRRITKEGKDAEVLIAQYEKWVAATPVREAEWSALTREYGELKRHYDFLVSQNLQADSALNLERKQRGSQFKIEDAAKQPTKPANPSFKKIMAVALIMGGGAGMGCILLLQKLDTSFRFPEDLEAAFPLEVLCAVPHLPLEEEVTRQHRAAAAGVFAFSVWALALLGALAFFWQKGQIIL